MQVLQIIKVCCMGSEYIATEQDRCLVVRIWTKLETGHVSALPQEAV